MGKKSLAVLLSFLFLSVSFAQQKDERPVYLRFPTLPQFKVQKLADGKVLTRDDLKKKMNTVFFIFSPDCKYCQQETEDIIRHINDFKGTQILMISHYPLEEVQEYYKRYQIADYPQITMAHDGGYFFPIYFGLKNLPSTFIYDIKGNLKKSFDGSVKVETILAEL